MVNLKKKTRAALAAAWVIGGTLNYGAMNAFWWGAYPGVKEPIFDRVFDACFSFGLGPMGWIIAGVGQHYEYPYDQTGGYSHGWKI
jgi:hypothetical protein